MEGAVVWEISPGSLFFHLVFDVYSAILGEQGYEYWELSWERKRFYKNKI